MLSKDDKLELKTVSDGLQIFLKDMLMRCTGGDQDQKRYAPQKLVQF